MAASNPNAAYWQKRFKAIENQANLTGANSLSYITSQYQQAAKEIEAQISTWYTRLAKNNGVTMPEAKQLLSGKALKEFKWSVQEYIQHGKENALNGLWMQQLENASAKFHITKLEALQLQNQAVIESLFSKQYQSVSKALGSVYQNSYYHSCYEIQKAFGIGWNISGIDENKLKAVLSTPWTTDSNTFSQRIWGNRQKLIGQLQSTLTQGVMTGKKPDKLIAEIEKKMNASQSNAGRLVMTESAAMSAMAQKNAFGELGVEEFEIVETLDSSTCEICGAMDGKHFPMSDYQVGVTAPPFHPWCRGCTCPYFNDEFTTDSERIARAADGTQYYIPGDTSYQEWKDAFVDGDKSGFDAVTNKQSGLTSYKAPAPQEPSAAPKKEYMTKKKLEGLVADADTQIEDLKKQFEFASGGFTYEEVITQHETLEDFAQGKKLAVLQDLQSQLNQITNQKADWQEALDKKIAAAEIKKLKKESLLLQEQADAFEIKTYSGIWKDDITTADWLSKHNSIQAKKDYFTNKLLYSSNEETSKWQALIQQLEEFDTEGKAYYDLQSKLKKLQGDLQLLQNGGKIDDAAAYTQARKDAALWAKSTKAADDRLRETCGQVWQKASQSERHAIYDYTSGSGKFNRPLSGFEKPWLESGTGWEQKYFKGVNQVWIDYEGAGDEIRAMTDLISRSTYDFDVWLQRGGSATEMDSLLNFAPGTFAGMSEADLQNLIGRFGRRGAFTSTGVAKGKGFSGEVIMNIYAPSGTQMMYAEPFSAFGQGGGKNWDGISKQNYFGSESEMIIQRGAYYKITKIERSSSGTIFVDMEVHPEQGYDLFQQDPTEWTGSTKKGK